MSVCLLSVWENKKRTLQFDSLSLPHTHTHTHVHTRTHTHTHTCAVCQVGSIKESLAVGMKSLETMRACGVEPGLQRQLESHLATGSLHVEQPGEPREPVRLAKGGLGDTELEVRPAERDVPGDGGDDAAAARLLVNAAVSVNDSPMAVCVSPPRPSSKAGTGRRKMEERKRGAQGQGRGRGGRRSHRRAEEVGRRAEDCCSCLSGRDRLLTLISLSGCSAGLPITLTDSCWLAEEPGLQARRLRPPFLPPLRHGGRLAAEPCCTTARSPCFHSSARSLVQLPSLLLNAYI